MEKTFREITAQLVDSSDTTRQRDGRVEPDRTGYTQAA